MRGGEEEISGFGTQKHPQREMKCTGIVPQKATTESTSILHQRHWCDPVPVKKEEFILCQDAFAPFVFVSNIFPDVCQIFFALGSHISLSPLCSAMSHLPHFLTPLQATRVLHVSRRWTRAPLAPVTTTAHATPRAPAPWGSAAAARRASPALPVPSWWTSVP